MKPIANVHWTLHGLDKSLDVYTEIMLSQLTAKLREAGAVYTVFILDYSIKLPSNKPKRYVKEVG